MEKKNGATKECEARVSCPDRRTEATTNDSKVSVKSRKSFRKLLDNDYSSARWLMKVASDKPKLRIRSK